MAEDAPELVPDGMPMDGATLARPGVRVWRGAVYRHHKDAGGWLRMDGEPLPAVQVSPRPLGASLSPPAAFYDPHTAERIENDGVRLTWPDGRWVDVPQGELREDPWGRVWRRSGHFAMCSEPLADWRLAREAT